MSFASTGDWICCRKIGGGKMTQERQGRVYPRVKVRQDHETAEHKEDTTVLLMKLVQSSTLRSSTSPNFPSRLSGNHQPFSRIARSTRSHSPAPSSSSGSRDSDKSSETEDDRQKIRASSVPRPRAVLSSPDNDAIIGNLNKKLKERKPCHKTQTFTPSTHADRKPAARSASAGRATARLKASKDVSVMSDPKEKPSQVVSSPRQRFSARKNMRSSTKI